MSQVDSRQDPHESAPIMSQSSGPVDVGTPVDARPEAWRVIAADGSSQAAPGQLDEATVARILANKPRHVPHFRAARDEREHGEELAPLIDFLGDEEVTLLDLDLLSCDLSLLSVDIMPVAGAAPNAPIEPEAASDEQEVVALPALSALPSSDSADRQLRAVIRAWPRLPEDLRDAIWWIARGGVRRAPRAQ